MERPRLSLRPGDGVVPFPGQPKPPASFEDVAASDFEPLNFDLSSIPSEAKLNDPYIVSFRLAAIMLMKSKADLVEIVRGLGAEEDDGGALAEIVDNLQASQAFFKRASEVMHAAELRLMVATFAANESPKQKGDEGAAR